MSEDNGASVPDRVLVPSRVQLRRTKGWRLPPNTVKVDRSTPWGNPYRAGVHCDHQHAVDCHRFLLTQRRPAKTAPWPDSDPLIYCGDALRNLDILRGKNLACWCPLDQPCHADVLLELANRDSDASLAEDAKRLSPEGVAARAEGIAQTQEPSA